MTPSRDTLSLIVGELPGRDALIDSVYRRNPAFRDLCGDYRRCATALERWRRSDDDASPVREGEYAKLLNQLREFETLPVTTTSTMLGVGLSTGFQYESLFGALSAQWATSVVNETGSELDILVATFLVGYDFGDIGLRLQTGAQYQDWDQAIRGEIALGGGRDPLEFDIDLSVDKTTFLVGLYKDFGRSWNATLLAGFGARDQLTMTVGYRF